MNENQDEPLFLDFYDNDEEILWCWKKGLYSSQEFSSEDTALEAHSNGGLVFSSLADEAALDALYATVEVNEGLKPPFDYWLIDGCSVWEPSADGQCLGELPDFPIATGMKVLKMSLLELKLLQDEFELLQG